MHLLLVLLATAFAVAPCCPPGAKCCPAPLLSPPLAPQTTKVVKAADPVPAPVVPADLMAAIAACEADKAAVAQAQAQTTAAQTALTSVQTQIATAQTAAVQAQANLTKHAGDLAAALAKLYPITVTPPTPPVNPPVDPPKPTDAVVLLEVSRTDCGACNLMDPVLEKLKAGGYVVSRVDCDKDSTAADKWKPERYPTFIMLLDGKENSRTTGMQTYDNLKSWLDGLKKFVLERGDAP